MELSAKWQMRDFTEVINTQIVCLNNFFFKKLLRKLKIRWFFFKNFG